MGRLGKIANLMPELGIDAMMLTSAVNMYYATLFRGLEGTVIIDKDGKGMCFTDSRYIEEAEEKISPLGYQVTEIPASTPALCVIADYFSQMHYKKVGYEDTRVTVAEYSEYQTQLQAELVPAGKAFEKYREIKEDEEIENLVKAQRIAERALNRLLPEIRPGAYEDELFAKLCYYLRMEGSQTIANEMILVSGKRTSMPHAHSMHKQVCEGDFVTIDFGADVNGYTSDMTRTFGVGHISEKMREVYNIVLEAQLAGIAAFQVGKTGKEVDAAARELIDARGYGAYFRHGLGHSVGLEVHEAPYARMTYDHPYRERNLTTIEPGIYLPDEFGVRIEDMVYLSPDGKKNLTEFPKQLMIL